MLILFYILPAMIDGHQALLFHFNSCIDKRDNMDVLPSPIIIWMGA